jgi:SMC interacting uncharacterized protein involved in chromosome segregation
MNIEEIQIIKDLIKAQNQCLKEIEQYIKRKNKPFAIFCPDSEREHVFFKNEFFKISKEIQNRISKLFG